MRDESQSTAGNRRRDADFMTVQTPKAHEGVGMALRHVYCAERSGLPADMMDMLDQLDQV